MCCDNFGDVRVCLQSEQWAAEGGGPRQADELWHSTGSCGLSNTNGTATGRLGCRQTL